MVQILPPRPDIGRSIGQGVNKGLSSYFQNENQQQQNQQLQGALGNISQQSNQPMNDEQKALQFMQAVAGRPDAENLTKNYLQSLKQTQSQAPKQEAPNPGIQALAEIESLIGQEGIGFTGSINPGGKAQFNRGKFKSLQAAILPIFKSMFPRGMTEKEFKFIQSNYIPQVSDTEDTIKGKIEGLRQLLGDQQGQQPQGMQQQNSNQVVQMRDQEGNVYDIPQHLIEQAQQKGLIPQ